jgi:hypothetical protein
MMLRALFTILILALAWQSGALAQSAVLAQNKVHTKTFRPPATSTTPAPAAPVVTGSTPQKKPPAKLKASHASKPDAVPEIITDFSRLPAPVARMRERILAAARSGDIDKVVTVMQSNDTMPVFSFSDARDPAAYWKANYPNSKGIEILSILVTVLETGFVHVDEGTPQEIYLWPYFARMPLKSITPEQKVELFRLITGADYKDMIDFGAYVFYRLGIAPDGTWHFFVAGD